jgi:hypothetical protein
MQEAAHRGGLLDLCRQQLRCLLLAQSCGRGPDQGATIIQSGVRRVGGVGVVMVNPAVGARNRRCDDRKCEKSGESTGQYLHGALQWLVKEWVVPGD